MKRNALLKCAPFLLNSRSSGGSSTDSGLLIQSSPDNSSCLINNSCNQSDSGLISSSRPSSKSTLSLYTKSSKKHKSTTAISAAVPKSAAASTDSLNCQLSKENGGHHQTSGSLTSLLKALPAASVDTGDIDSEVNKSAENVAKARMRGQVSGKTARMASPSPCSSISLSSLSLDSRTSDFDSYFYI